MKTGTIITFKYGKESDNFTFFLLTQLIQWVKKFDL
jgi:hypothetical protein